MSDNDVEVTQQGWLDRLGGSFLAVVFGIVLFFASFVVLYWNEGRAVADMTSLNTGESLVVSVSETSVDPAHQNQLVHVSGPVSARKAAGDPVFHVSVPNAVRLERHVKMYQWDESKDEDTHQNVGGSETKTTTYSYKKIWSEKAIDSSDFKKSDGHVNPTMPLHSVYFNADTVKIGAFHLDKSAIDKMSGFETLAPPDSADALKVDPSFRKVGEQFYHGASPDNPAIGDMQVTYDVIAAQPYSVIGVQFGDTLGPFRGKDGKIIEMVEQGTRDANDMFAQAKSEAATLTWILRGVGFLMMVIGIAMMAAPLAWLASVLPFLTGIVDSAALMVALTVSIPLTLITIALAWVTHRPLIGGGLIMLGLVLGFAFHRLMPRRRNRQEKAA